MWLEEVQDALGPAMPLVERQVGSKTVYLLTNAHRRRVTLQMNGRELYHFSRLREDCHAQWDIRSLAKQMLDLVRSAAPLTMRLSGGKSELDLPGNEIQ